MKRFVHCSALATSLALLAIGCGQPSTSDISTSSETTESRTDATPDAPAIEELDESTDVAEPSPIPDNTPPPHALISNTGIGVADLGMTFSEFQQAIGDAYTLEPIAPFMVDFDAIAVQQAGEVQYYILHLAGMPFTDDDIIQGLHTDNPRYQTAEGVGPGSAIATAETLYGNATLSYNFENEGREYVRFEDFELTNIVFGTGNANLETAGIYPEPTSSYNETEDYREDAVIESVLLVCLTANCTNTIQ
jgi:hypothetical protein